VCRGAAPGDAFAWREAQPGPRAPETGCFVPRDGTNQRGVGAAARTASSGAVGRHTDPVCKRGVNGVGCVQTPGPVAADAVDALQVSRQAGRGHDQDAAHAHAIL
jgi:hypothetical protein